LRIPFLLSSPELEPAQQWRLMSSLYEQPNTLIGGSFALVGLLAVCLFRTGAPVFAILAAGTLGVLAVRLLQRRWFWHCNPAGPPAGRRSAEAWARDFTVGSIATAFMWGATDLVAILGFHDDALHLFVLMVQGGWMGSLATRNAASPAVVHCQTLIPGLLTLLALALRPPGFVQVAIPFLLMHIAANMGITRFAADRMTSVLQSEQRLARANAQLLMLSTTDGLTGIANRRALDDRLAAVWAQAIRDSADVALLIADVDYFKNYNDHYGHLRGDDCLRRITFCLGDALVRETDFAARYGGEEFAALLPTTAEQGALQVAERLRQGVLAAGLTHAASPFGQVTVSVGVASMGPTAGDDPLALVTLADGALYAAKRAGRNQVAGACAQLPIGRWRPADAGRRA
jgi:diguanylate cyclase (GGDEF)-like protein